MTRTLNAYGVSFLYEAENKSLFVSLVLNIWIFFTLYAICKKSPPIRRQKCCWSTFLLTDKGAVILCSGIGKNGSGDGYNTLAVVTYLKDWSQLFSSESWLPFISKYLCKMKTLQKELKQLYSRHQFSKTWLNRKKTH